MLRAWVDGRLVPAEQATVSVYDRGFRTGEGVFETLRAYGSHVFRLDAHLARARAGAEQLGFDIGPCEELATAVHEIVEANHDVLGGADSALRLTVSPGRIDPGSPIPGRPVGGPTVVVTSHPLATPTAPSTAITVPWARELPHVKAVSFLIAIIAQRQARAAGAGEALLTDGAGQVLEGATSNVFAVVSGRLVTPPTNAGLLAGVTREVVLELARELDLEVAQQPLTVAELRAAEEAFLTSTTRELVPLVRVDDAPIADGGKGPITARLQRVYAGEVERERARRER